MKTPNEIKDELFLAFDQLGKDAVLIQYIETFKKQVSSLEYLSSPLVLRRMNEMQHVLRNDELSNRGPDGVCYDLKSALIKLKLLQFFSSQTTKTGFSFEATVFSCELGRLVDEISRAVKEDGGIYCELIQAAGATASFLVGELTVERYKNVANQQKGHPQLRSQLIGGIMLGLAVIVAAMGVASVVGFFPAMAISSILAGVGLFKMNRGAARQVAAPMLELAKYKGFNDRLIEEEGETHLFPQGLGTGV